MPRPKDSKVWNEDLILALQVREQIARQNGRRNHLALKTGRQQIESVRGDIYKFKNGRIVNLPTKLKTSIDNLCRCIIAGTEPILPAGYVPANMRPKNGENPYVNDPYLKSIKKRGGAYAILMAFYTAAYDDQVLTKEEICRLAQPYCDTEMEANFMAGRSRGAWSSIKTLEDHDFIMVQKRRVHYDGNAGGFRSLGSNSYMLTANGKLFIQAFFQRNPDLKNEIKSAGDTTPGRSRVTSGSFNGFTDFGFFDGQGATKSEESWQHDYQPFTLPSTASLPLKTSPSRPFSSLLESGHVLDASPSAKRHLQFIPAGEAARLAALERHAIHESILMAKCGNGATGRREIDKNRAPINRKHSTPTKSSVATANKVTPSSVSIPFSVSNQERQRLNPPPVIALYNDDSDDETDDRKMPANPYHRTTTASTHSLQQKSSLEPSKIPILLDIDSDSDDDIFLQSPVSSKMKPVQQAQHVGSTIDLTNKVAAQTYDDIDSDDEWVQIQSQSSEVQVIESENIVRCADIDNHEQQPILPTSKQLTIYIDDRERNRNATPRTLRMELTRLVSSESKGNLLSIVWPKHIPRPIIEESRIPNGDFSFHQTILPAPASASSQPSTITIPILVERKRIGDIVQRSTKKDHWYQLHRMQDEAIGRIKGLQNKLQTNYGICIILLEGDPRTARQYEAYGAQSVDTTSPFVHTIDDEEILYRYMCRAILNDQDQTTRFVQTNDEQGSLRMIGVLGLMSITNERLLQVNQNMPQINTKAERVCIIKRLQNCGIPWTLVTRITDEIRSIKQMDKLYSSIDDLSCRELVLVPLINDLCNTDELSSTASAWSKAIHCAWNSKLPDPTTAMKHLKELSELVEDHALLVEKLHGGLSAERALDEVLEMEQRKHEKQLDRIVCVDLPRDFADCFPSSSTSAATVFRLNIVERPQKILSIVMQTYAGPFYSSRLILFTLDGDDIVRRIQGALKDVAHGQRPDYIEISKTLAEKIYRDFCVVTAKDDTVVLLIRALGLALDNAAKKNEYRSEVRVLAEMIQAELMIEHKTIILHAIRLHGNDREMIIRQVALACYHYHMLRYKSKSTAK